MKKKLEKWVYALLLLLLPAINALAQNTEMPNLFPRQGRVFLYSATTKKSILIEETYLIGLLNDADTICIKIDTIEQNQYVKTMEVSFHSENVSGAYFESRISTQEPWEVDYVEFDMEDTYVAIIDYQLDDPLVAKLNQMLRGRPSCDDTSP
ncbi:MAG: hypothetical protein WCJ39_06205 [bacterium]